MKRISILLLSILLSFPLAAGNAKFSVLTCWPGDEAYSLFGHTGLRYCDEEKGIDVVFNYGYFDFDTPNFIWRFVLGETDYMVGAVSYSTFRNEYMQRGSLVKGQYLNLTPEQEETLYHMLVVNCRPVNRVYRYNYFYNNCTTKIRDKVMEVCDSVVFDADVEYPTFRDALNALLVNHPWYAFGINLMMGADVDRPASLHELQFIPKVFMNNLDKAYTFDENGERVPFVNDVFLVLPEEESQVTVHSNLTPFNAALLLLLATFVVMLCEVRSKKTFWGYDVLLMSLQGLAGCLLLFMALFSQHPAVDNNWLILLLNPLALVLMPILVCRIRRHKPLSLAWIKVIFIFLFLLSAILSLQVYPIPVYFCAIALLVRSLFLIYKEKICELSRF